MFGATGWVAPLWLGQPVQWCGLVYADALYQLAAFDPANIWKQVADGIAAAGIQHTWPASDRDRQGLLPDFYLLRSQRSEGPAINPGTLLACAGRLFDEELPYSMRSLVRFTIHAPGRVEVIDQNSDGAVLRVHLAMKRPGHVWVTGLWRRPDVKIDGRIIELNAPHQYEGTERRLVLFLERSSTVDLRYPPADPSNSPGVE